LFAKLYHGWGLTADLCLLRVIAVMACISTVAAWRGWRVPTPERLRSMGYGATNRDCSKSQVQRWQRCTARVWFRCWLEDDFEAGKKFDA